MSSYPYLHIARDQSTKTLYQPLRFSSAIRQINSSAIGHLKREWAIRKLEGVCELDLTDQNEAQMVERVCALWEAMSGGTAVDLTNGTRKAQRLV